MSDSGWPKIFESDNRPGKGGWAPGSYFGACGMCDKKYIGDKRSASCADCAYSKEGDYRYKAHREGLRIERLISLRDELACMEDTPNYLQCEILNNIESDIARRQEIVDGYKKALAELTLRA